MRGGDAHLVSGADEFAEDGRWAFDLHDATRKKPDRGGRADHAEGVTTVLLTGASARTAVDRVLQKILNGPAVDALKTCCQFEQEQ